MVEQPGAQANAAAPSMPKSLRTETPTTDPSTARVDRSRGAATIAIVFAILFWLYRNPRTRVPGT